jgi:hypothetical protein
MYKYYYNYNYKNIIYKKRLAVTVSKPYNRYFFARRSDRRFPKLLIIEPNKFNNEKKKKDFYLDKTRKSFKVLPN